MSDDICPYCGSPAKVRTYRLHWLGGKTEDCRGVSIAAAMTHMGYGQGALRALDYYEEIQPPLPSPAPTEEM